MKELISLQLGLLLIILLYIGDILEKILEKL